MKPQNDRRNFLTPIKTNIRDFKRFSDDYVHYLFRDKDGNISVYRTDEVLDTTVSFPASTDRLPRDYVGENLSLVELASDNVSVLGTGNNPNRVFDGQFDCGYYTYLDTTWKAIDSDACVNGIFPSFSKLVKVDTDDIFMASQVGGNVVIYEVTTTSVTKKAELTDYILVDAKSMVNDVILFVVKRDIEYPYEIIEEDFGETIQHYAGSPEAILCLASGSYSTFRSFCTERSIFPSLCSLENPTDDNSFFIYDSYVYAISVSYDPVNSIFVPVVGFGKDNDEWRFFASSTPFGLFLT